jgi:hypothetical protein
VVAFSAVRPAQGREDFEGFWTAFRKPAVGLPYYGALPVRSGNGSAVSLDLAKTGFRTAFERFESETPDRAFARLYECVPRMRDRQQKATWTAKFQDPIPLPDGGSIKNLSDARAYLLALSERERLKPKWQEVASHLIKATTVERGWTLFARLALYKAIHGKGPDGPPAPDVRKPDTWRERRRARKSTGAVPLT